MFRNNIVCTIDASEISALIKISKKMICDKNFQNKVGDLVYQGPGPYARSGTFVFGKWYKNTKSC